MADYFALVDSTTRQIKESGFARFSAGGGEAEVRVPAGPGGFTAGFKPQDHEADVSGVLTLSERATPTVTTPTSGNWAAGSGAAKDDKIQVDDGTTTFQEDGIEIDNLHDDAQSLEVILINRSDPDLTVEINATRDGSDTDYTWTTTKQKIKFTPGAVDIGDSFDITIDGTLYSFTSTNGTVAEITGDLTSQINGDGGAKAGATDNGTDLDVEADTAGDGFTFSSASVGGTMGESVTQVNVNKITLHLLFESASGLGVYDIAMEPDPFHKGGLEETLVDDTEVLILASSIFEAVDVTIGRWARAEAANSPANGTDTNFNISGTGERGSMKVMTTRWNRQNHRYSSDGTAVLNDYISGKATDGEAWLTDFTVEKGYITAKTAPTVTSLQITVKNETTTNTAVFTLSAASKFEATTLGTKLTINKGDKVSVQITQIGSGVAGADIMFTIEGVAVFTIEEGLVIVDPDELTYNLSSSPQFSHAVADIDFTTAPLSGVRIFFDHELGATSKASQPKIGGKARSRKKKKHA